ncbi:hypothetical protein A0J51_03288 [Gluconobacter japonicus]|nr:hypothetical protein A0J51_03288 [Gluconobacter japonicus]
MRAQGCRRVAFEELHVSHQHAKCATIIDKRPHNVTGAAGIGDNPDAFNTGRNHEHHPTIVFPDLVECCTSIRNQGQIALISQRLGVGLYQAGLIFSAGFNLAENWLDGFTGHDKWRCSLVPAKRATAPDGHHIALLREGPTVSGIKIALGQHAISHNDRMIFGFDMVVIVRCDGRVVEDRAAIHEHPGWHELAVKK